MSPPARRWEPDGDARGVRQARRARKPRPCVTCSWPEFVIRIQPGDIYLHHTLFPGNDIWDNRTPMTAAECAACARRYERATLIEQREKSPR